MQEVQCKIYILTYILVILFFSRLKHMKTDEYFESQSEKAITSNHTLGRLRNPRLTEQTLKELLTNENYVSEAHKTCICNLTENYKSFFPMWQFIME